MKKIHPCSLSLNQTERNKDDDNLKKGNHVGRPSKILLIFAALILMTLTFAALTLAGTAAAEEIQTGESIAPMKMKIDMDATDEIITKMIYLKNTGNTPTNYIFYTEQNGGKNEISSKFQLAETETMIAPGDTFELSLTISKEEIEKYNSKELESVKIKIIRNPESQTPVGYIIPVEIGHLDEKEKNETAGNKTSSTGVAGGIIGTSEKTSAASNDAKNEGNPTKEEKTIKEEKDGKTDLREGGNKNQSRTAKTVIAVGILSALAVLIGGLYLNQKRKKE